MNDAIMDKNRYKPQAYADIDALLALHPDKTYKDDGYVYVVEYGEHLVKIGCTNNIKTRMMALRKSAEDYNGNKLGMVAVTPEMPYFRDLESVLHDYFSDERRSGTELFDVEFVDVLDVMDRINYSEYDDEWHKQQHISASINWAITHMKLNQMYGLPIEEAWTQLLNDLGMTEEEFLREYAPQYLEEFGYTN